MTNETLKTLESLGLSQNEAKVYLTLLKTGLTTATEIARESKLHRPNVYDSIHTLIDKGLASFITIEKTKKFKATHPKNLVLLLKQKEIDLQKIIPQLELEETLCNSKESFAEINQGLKAFRIAFFNLLDYNKTIYAFGIPKNVPQIVSSFINNFHKKRIEKKITMLHIYNEDARDRIKHLNTMEFTEAGYLPEQFNSPVTTITSGSEMLIIRWQPSLTFIRIIDDKLSETYQKYCTQLLKEAKKY